MAADPPLDAPLRDEPEMPDDVDPPGRETAPLPDPPDGGEVRVVAVPPVRTAPPDGRRAWPSPDFADPDDPAPDDDELDPDGVVADGEAAQDIRTRTVRHRHAQALQRGRFGVDRRLCDHAAADVTDDTGDGSGLHTLRNRRRGES